MAVSVSRSIPRRCIGFSGELRAVLSLRISNYGSLGGLSNFGIGLRGGSDLLVNSTLSALEVAAIR